MSSIRGFLFHESTFLSLWGWLTLILVLVGFNEFVQRAKWTKAQSTFQGIMRLLLRAPVLSTVLTRFPLFGPIIKTVLEHLAAKRPETPSVAESFPDAVEVAGEVQPEPEAPKPPKLPPTALVLLMAGLGMLSACKANPYDVVVAFKTTAASTLTITMNGFEKYDDEHQKAVAKEEGSAGLKKYREEVQLPMRSAIKTALNAIALLSAAIDAWKAGLVQDWGKLTAEVLRGFAEITEIITRYGLPVPKPSLETSKEPGALLLNFSFRFASAVNWLRSPPGL